MNSAEFRIFLAENYDSSFDIIFVVCKKDSEHLAVKFHSLYKLQKKSTEKSKFSKFHKLKSDKFQFNEREESKINNLTINLSAI